MRLVFVLGRFTLDLDLNFSSKDEEPAETIKLGF